MAAALSTTRTGRVLLHLLALTVDHALQFHWDGVMRELKGE